MGFKQVTVSRLINPGKDINHGGERLFSDDFVEKLYDSEEESRSPIIVDLNELIGIQQWAIMFVENIVKPDTFEAHVYLEDDSRFSEVEEIISRKMGKKVPRAVLKGDLNAYLGPYEKR